MILYVKNVMTKNEYIEYFQMVKREYWLEGRKGLFEKKIN